MKAFILAAGRGTRLKPWTDYHPKALAEVNGIPMIENVINLLRSQGVTDIAVNIHHFGNQIIDFLNSRGYNDIKISDERENLLETGGALVKAASLLLSDPQEPILVHNVDILSDLKLGEMENFHKKKGGEATLLISDRESTRKLVFDSNRRLKGWHSLKDSNYRPESFVPKDTYFEVAFNGIYIINPSLIRKMQDLEYRGRFSIIDFFMDTLNLCEYYGYGQDGLRIIDIGKPESLDKAQTLFTE